MLIAVGGWLFAAAFSQGEPLTAKKLLSLDGVEFREKAKQAGDDPWKNFTSGELADVAQRWAKELKGKTSDFNEIHPFEGLFSVACRKAGSADFDKLIEAYLVLGNEAEATEYLFPFVADACIERELNAIKREHFRLALPKVTEELPTELRQAPRELQEAWTSYKAARMDFKANLARDNGHGINFENNEKAFGELLGSVLKGDGKGDSEKLFRFFSSNDCIVIGSGFDVWRARALVLALLKERKLSEAAGAALDLRLASRTTGLEESETSDPTVDVLTALGLDWEKIAAGGQLNLQGSPFDSSQAVFLNELSAFGTDRAASLMVLLAGQAEEKSRPEYASAIRVFIADDKPHSLVVEADGEDPEETVVVMPDRPARISRVRISEKLQKQLLGILVGWAKPNVSNELGEELVRAFESTDDRAVIQGLKQMAAHPSHEIASRAADRLKSFGEKAPEIAKLGPVRFEILLNGKKLSPGMNVDWRLNYEDHTSSSSLGEVDEHSYLSFEHDRFVEPSRKVTSVTLSSWNSEPAFNVDVPVSPDLSKLTTVQVEFVPLEVDFDLARLRNRKRLAEVKVTLAPKAGPSFSPRYEKTGRSGEPMTLLVQKGEYTMTAQAIGAASWESAVHVSRESSSISVPLQTGSDVHLRVFKPKGDEASGEMLFHNGMEMENWRDDKGRYRGLSPGNYVIHIPSSKERREIFPGESAEAGPDEVDYAGRDLAVAVGENSPPVIDLGEIRLQTLGR